MKSIFYSLTTLFLILGLGFSVQAQEAQTLQSKSEVQVTKARLLGKTAPIRDLAGAPRTSLRKLKKSKQNKPHSVPNFIGRNGAYEVNPNALPVGADPVRQNNTAKNTGLVVEPKFVIEGMDIFDGGAGVPDPCGDIGTNYYVQNVNVTYFQIFDKEGNAVTNPISMNTIWQDLGVSSGGDPIILYDQEADRWLMTEFAPPFGQNKLLMAISETGDPTGSWFAYEFTTPSFPDYPKYGIWNNCYYLTTNEGQTPIYFINRDAMINGEDEVDMQRITIPNGNAPGFYVPTPVDWDGPTPPSADSPPTVLRLVDDSWNGTNQDGIQIWTFDIDWENANNSGANGPTLIETADFDSYPCSAETGGFACVPQPSGGGIDAIPYVLMHRMPYRNFGTHESIVMNFVVDATAGDNVSGIRWVELRRMPGEDWALYQEGTYAPDDGEHRFMGGIAMDAAGNIGMAFSVSGEDTYPSLRLTGRRASDPLGEMTIEEYEFGTGLSISQTDRYGDYASMSVDPVNDRTFWYTGEYMKNNNNWGTKIVAFEIQRDSIDIGVFALNSPESSENLTDSEVVKFEVKNYGLDTQMVFQVGYIFEDEPAIVEDINFVLAPDSVYTHTFVQPVNMDEIRSYELKLFSSLTDDQALYNDTLRTTISKLSRYDAGISNIKSGMDVICADSALLIFVLKNYGVDTLTEVEIHVLLNGTEIQVINWTGSLNPGIWTNVPIGINGFTNGLNTLTAFTQNPNGQEDEIMENDQFSRPLQAFPNGVSIEFQIRTDNYPEEISWELTDSQGNVVYEGGDYTFGLFLYKEDWCLDPDECYVFTISDTYGDGMSSPFGDFTIEDTEGHELAALMDVNFGTQEVHEFCATFECTLSATVSLTPATGEEVSDGVISVNAENGGSDLEYSIDGGVTFQFSPLFSGLPAGAYQVVVQDADNCETTVDNVVIDIMVGTSWLEAGQKIELFPNPTNGIFKMNIEGIDGKERLDFTVRNALGKIIQHNYLVRYNETLTGEFSIISQPAGLYFLVFNDPAFNNILKIVKQ
jgi:hypothetical protein